VGVHLRPALYWSSPSRVALIDRIWKHALIRVELIFCTHLHGALYSMGRFAPSSQASSSPLASCLCTVTQTSCMPCLLGASLQGLHLSSAQVSGWRQGLLWGGDAMGYSTGGLLLPHTTCKGTLGPYLHIRGLSHYGRLVKRTLHKLPCENKMEIH
jgi:hypothetical protein